MSSCLRGRGFLLGGTLTAHAALVQAVLFTGYPVILQLLGTSGGGTGEAADGSAEGRRGA